MSGALTLEGATTQPRATSVASPERPSRVARRRPRYRTELGSGSAASNQDSASPKKPGSDATVPTLRAGAVAVLQAALLPEALLPEALLPVALLPVELRCEGIESRWGADGSGAAGVDRCWLRLPLCRDHHNSLDTCAPSPVRRDRRFMFRCSRAMESHISNAEPASRIAPRDPLCRFST